MSKNSIADKLKKAVNNQKDDKEIYKVPVKKEKEILQATSITIGVKEFKKLSEIEAFIQEETASFRRISNSTILRTLINSAELDEKLVKAFLEMNEK